jgi:hypothetical protein
VYCSLLCGIRFKTWALYNPSHFNRPDTLLLVQIAKKGARFYKERAHTLPYYFTTGQCSHDVLVSERGLHIVSPCTEPVRPTHIFDTSMTCLYCWEHYTQFRDDGSDDNRCPCPLPTDGSRCSNPRDGAHCCSQVDEVQNCRQWYYDTTNKYPDKFCAPHCRLDEDNFELYGQ